MIISKYRYLFPLIISFSSSAVYAEIYKCKDTNGNVTYSEKPCADNERKIELKVSPHEHKYEKKSNQRTIVFELNEGIINNELKEDFIVTEDSNDEITLTPKDGDTVIYNSENK